MGQVHTTTAKSECLAWIVIMLKTITWLGVNWAVSVWDGVNKYCNHNFFSVEHFFSALVIAARTRASVFRTACPSS